MNEFGDFAIILLQRKFLLIWKYTEKRCIGKDKHIKALSYNWFLKSILLKYKTIITQVSLLKLILSWSITFHSILFTNVLRVFSFIPSELGFLEILLNVVYSYFLQLISATTGSFSKSQEFDMAAALETVTLLSYLHEDSCTKYFLF